MATSTKTRSTRTRKAAPVVEPEEIEDELETDDELEELEEDTVEEAAPAKSGGGNQQQVTFGVADLAKYLQEQGHKVDTRGLRTLIRKMARDGSNRVNREIVAGNRTRYDWPKGLNDPEVKKIIKAYNDGELEADKKEKLDALKARKAAQTEAAGKVVEAAKTSKRKAKAKAAPEPVVEDDEDDEDLELED